MRGRIILLNQEGRMDKEIAEILDINRHTVELCLNKCVSMGWESAVKDIARAGRSRVIDDADKAWVTYIACHKPKDLDLAAELWTITELQKYIRTHAAENGHPALEGISRSKLWTILDENELKPHKVTYYLEKRDPEFDSKMRQVLYVYKLVEWTNQKMADDEQYRPDVITISYDEKPGIQALGGTVEDFTPIPGKYRTVQRDYEYVRHGTVSLLAGIDLHDGTVTALVRDSHKSSDFIEFLKALDSRYPDDVNLRIILDNHSSHISKETRLYLQNKPLRFTFVFTPKHGSWLNLVEGFFGKLAHTALRGIRVDSKSELKRRILLAIEEINRAPVVHHWTYKMDETAI
jgi:transposase